ncbi:MAG: hypothetical protein QOH49_671 [Acidobacteriota bacterium]|nr:hypothetical protein [Acidobacteriota bacterium]
MATNPRSLSTLVLAVVCVGGRRADDTAGHTHAGMPLAFARVPRRAWRVTTRPAFGTGKRFSAHAYGAANARGDCDKTGGTDTKSHVGKTTDSGQTAGHNRPAGRHADINANTNATAILNMIANTNHCLCSQMAPTSVV